MIEVLTDLPENVLGFEAKGEVTGDDYEQVLIPAVEKHLQTSEKIRLLYVLGEDFEDYSAAAMWDDTRLGMSHLTAWERIAVVTDHSTYGHMVRVFGFMIPAEVKAFSVEELEAARGWVSE